ncbi:MAG: histidine kinase [Eubacterium sp.]|nr:histidine kinase [Eubacterium sp.]
MSKTASYTLKNGSVLVTVCGHSGEEDFYAMYDVIKEVIEPERIKYGVDSMCVDGSFIKDGITVRMSSESAYDDMCFLYDPSKMTEEQVNTTLKWIDLIVDTFTAKA